MLHNLLLFLAFLSLSDLSIKRFFYNRTAPKASLELTQEEFLTKSENIDRSWMLERIEKDLSAYPKLSRQFLYTFLGKHNVILFTIRDGKLTCTPDDPGEVRFDALKSGIENILACTQLPDVDFLITRDDHFDTENFQGDLPPIFVFAKNKNAKGLILFPDFSCFATRTASYAFSSHIYPTILKTDKVWKKKKNQAIWRGGTSGMNTDWQRAPRMELCKLSQEYPKLIDAKFSFFTQLDPSIKPQVPMGNFLTPTDQLAYKYLICLDGNTCTYPGLHWRLLANSVVLKHESDNIQWFYDALTPFEHYIPIKNDCANLVAMLSWAEANDPQAEKIAQNATDFAKENLSTAAIYLYVKCLLEQYAKKFS
ncbi:MAG: hypothetical protein MRY21_01045 [Simkaniaceae bacterium]|nr:hypothetical protein [Simkaniaceae bacterium]